MSEFHVMGTFLDPRQTKNLESMDRNLGKVVAADLWTLAIDESLECWFWHFRMAQDYEAELEDEHEGKGKENSIAVHSLCKKHKSVFDDSDEEDDCVIVTKPEIEKFMELAMTVPSK